MVQQGAAIYQQAGQISADPRELEATVLMKAAAKLQALIDNPEEISYSELDEALSYNRKLWTILVSSATEASNPLPLKIKENIANLGIFVFNHTMEVLSSTDKNELDILININRNIAEGLRGNP